jgi:hypothetical protein
MSEKLRQMGTASLRAYLDGPNTLPMRKKTVMAYLNTVPLAAAPRFGEVHGVGDGLWAWYGLDFAEINKTLSRKPRAKDPAYASALKHVLSLIVAERRPSYYLAANRKALDASTDDHLDLLANAKLISRDGQPGQADRTAHGPSARRPAPTELRRPESHQRATHPGRRAAGRTAPVRPRPP